MMPILSESDLKDLIVLQTHRLTAAQATINSQTALLARARDQLTSLSAKVTKLEAASMPPAPLPTVTVRAFEDIE